MVIIRGQSQENIVSTIEKACKVYCGSSNSYWDKEKISINRWYWDEVTSYAISNDTSGMARATGLKIFSRGFGDELSRLAPEFAAVINVSYNDTLRFKTRVFNLGLMRQILHQDSSISRLSEHDLWFYKYKASTDEFEGLVKIIKSRIK